MLQMRIKLGIAFFKAKVDKGQHALKPFHRPTCLMLESILCEFMVINGKPRTRNWRTRWSQWWVTVPHLRFWLEAVGEPHIESPYMRGPTSYHGIVSVVGLRGSLIEFAGQVKKQPAKALLDLGCTRRCISDWMCIKL